MIHSNKSTEQRQIVTKVDELMAKGERFGNPTRHSPPRRTD